MTTGAWGLRVRAFAKARGQRAKTDLIDAAVITCARKFLTYLSSRLKSPELSPKKQHSCYKREENGRRLGSAHGRTGCRRYRRARPT